MDILEAIYKRKSNRSFYPDKIISPQIVKTILEAGIQAPSGKNGQPWKFAIVEDNKRIKELSRLSVYKKVIINSSCLIFVYLDRDKSYDYKKDILAIGACIQNILLAACAQGIASCWNGDILRNEDKVNNILNMPSDCELMSMIILGYEDLDKTIDVKKAKRINLNKKIDIWLGYKDN